jgi:gluconokinase
MPASLLKSQFDTLEVPGPGEAIAVSIDQPEEAITDDVMKELHLS